MKKTLFLASILVCCAHITQAATYTDLTSSWCDEANHVIYDGKGYFAVESDSTTSVDLTISLDSLVSYVNSNDYKTGGYMLLWDMNVADYGMADNADTTLATGTRTPFISGYWNDAAWNKDTNNISYDTLSQYATNGSLTLTITSNSLSGVTVSTVNSSGSTVSLYTASNLRTDKNTQTSGYYVNLNYVTAVTLNTASTLDTDSYVPPVDYSAPFVSSRTDGTTIGRVTFLGDSITHGVNDQSYRWQFFKTLVDNGIENEIAGPREGYYSSPGHTEDAGSNYGGATFANVHLAQASGRTHNIISGSTSTTVNGTPYSSGVNYGGHSTASTGENYDSNTWICMMGTNDMLSDSGSSTTDYCNKMAKMLGGSVEYTDGKYVWTADANNTGTMGTIVDDVYNDGDTFYMLSITPWGDHANSNTESFHYGAQEFNRNLKEWVSTYSANTGKNVVYVDVTRGMVDLTSSISFDSHNAFWNNPGSDGLHPNDQGSIIMAGNLARGMGIGGRTAGLARADKNTANTTWHSASVGTNGTVAAGSSTTVAEYIFTEDGGYTVDFSAAFGDGAANGWLGASSSMSITIGDGANSGTLNLSEGYIMWGTDVLFCADTSALDENLRIAWHNGNSTDNVLGGYYVWLGDMLIGQGLASSTTGSALNGITVSAHGATGSVTGLTWANTAYAPTTTLMTSTEHAYTTTQTAGNTELQVNSGVDYTGAASTNATEGQVLVTSGTTKTTYTGTLTSANADTTQTDAWVGMVNTEFSDDVNVQFTGNITATIFGAMNNGSGAGAGKLVLDIAEDSIIGADGLYRGVTAALAGSYGGGKADEFNVFINGGTLGNNVVGGSVHGAGNIDSVLIALNSGTIDGNIYGGSNNDDGKTDDAGVQAIANAVVGKADIIINGGEVTGSIIAGGSAGTIGNVEVVITDGIIGRDITKGAATRTADASTNVTVIGNKASIGGNIEADTVTLRDIEASDSSTGFDKYSNTITAKKLVLSNVQTAIQARINVEEIMAGGSDTSIIMGDTATLESLTLDANTTFGAFKAAENLAVETNNETTLTLTTLTVGKGATLNANIVLGADSTLSLEGCLTMGSTVSLTSGMTIDLSADMLALMYDGKAIDLFTSVDSLTLDGNIINPDTVTNVNFTVDDKLQNFNMGYSNEGGTVSITLVPEPTTATLSLLALAALAARRRRK